MMLMLLTVLMVGNEPLATTDAVAVIHTQHFYDSDGRHVFTQRIFWELNKDGAYHCRDWRMVKPEQHHYPAGKIFTWHDGTGIRKVQAASVREDHSQIDAELADRAEHPKESRTELTTPPTLRRAKQLIEAK
jgi:hypothetical protein